jgi:F-type H+-transporting ATPase subunit b
MPQITQLPMIFFSQLFWLLVLASSFSGSAVHGAEDPVHVDARKAGADDLAAAQPAGRPLTRRGGLSYRSRKAGPKGEADPGGQAAAPGSGPGGPPPTRCRGALYSDPLRDAARVDAENVAAEAAQDMVKRLAGLSVSKAKRPGRGGGMSHG